MNVTHKTWMDGVELIAVHTDKFKTGVLGVTLVTPMKRETVTANALLADVLYRGCERYPDMEAISAATDELYGASISPFIRQKGESQCVSLRGSFIDDKYALDGSKLLEPVAELMGQLLLHPVTENGVFRRDYVESEGGNLADEIRAQMNEKRSWSILRLTAQMCSGEAYGLDKLGFADEAEQMDPAALWAQYQNLLRSAGVIFYYAGSAEQARVEEAIRAAFAPLLTPRGKSAFTCQVVAEPKEVREFTDRMDVGQGKLALGFRTGGLTAASPEYPALLVCNAMYGGNTNSKLFLNVREKLSLCYFASSMMDKLKGIMVVSSGVEFANFQKAKDEILAQLDAMRKGDFSREDLEIGRRSISSSMKTLLDSQSRLEEFWLTQAVAGREETPEETGRLAEEVTAAQVASAASKIQLDSVYYLTGKEA